MRLLILLAITLPLCAQDAVERAKADSARAAQYHRLVVAVNAAQAKYGPKIQGPKDELAAFLEQFRRDCEARGQQLGPKGDDPGCVPKPARPAPAKPEKEK